MFPRRPARYDLLAVGCVGRPPLTWNDSSGLKRIVWKSLRRRAACRGRGVRGIKTALQNATGRGENAQKITK
jgi:hypothetical protein